MTTVVTKPLKLLALTLLMSALTSCVTYYYPAAEQADGVYYAADDPTYAVGTGDYAGVAYYPWWSVDYFYLGYGYYNSGVSIGFSYGYPRYSSYGWGYYPSRYPAWYYDPWYYSYWYAPVYYYNPWYGYSGHHAYAHVHYRHYRDRHDRGHDNGYHRPHESDRFAGNGRRRPDDRLVEPTDRELPNGGERNTRYERGGSWAGSGEEVRQVTVAPDSRSTDRGMIVGSRDGGKWSRSRLEPVTSSPVSRSRPDTARSTGYDTVQSGAATVRSPANSKVSRSRITPVADPAPARQVVDKRADAWGAADSGTRYRTSRPGGGASVKSPGLSKPTNSRVQPTTPPVAVSRSSAPARAASAPPPRAPARSTASKSSRAGKASKPVRQPSRGKSKKD